MMMQEDRTSKSSGYVEIPIHVLYKTEYIDSVVQQRRKNNNSLNMLKMAKLRIRNTFSRLKDRISTALRGYYQEIVINNVDGKTRQNMIGYIKSLNLETKEFLDPDGTRVIVVDIGPIKKKPEMNDLLVYIENEKLKIARRTEAKSKCLNDKGGTGKSFIKLTVSNHCQVSSENATSESVKVMVHPKGGGDSIVKSNKVEAVNNRSRAKAKHQVPNIAKSVIDSAVNKKKEAESSDKESRSIETPSGPIKFKSNEPIVEDPLTKAERKFKLRMKNKCKATRAPEFTVDNNETSISKTANTCESSSTGEQDKKKLLSTSVEEGSSSGKIGWPVNSFLNSQMNGIGVFWNAESVMVNDTKINLIERSNAIKEKETSVNVIAQYYNKDKAKDETYSGSSRKCSHYKEKATEIDKNICFNQDNPSKILKETPIMPPNLEKENTWKNSKSFRKEGKNHRKPLIQIKDVEPYMSNGVMSDPSFQFNAAFKTPPNSAKETFRSVKGSVTNLTSHNDTDVVKKKKKRKFFKFCRKIFSNKKSDKKTLNKKTIICNSSEVVPVEVRVKCITTNGKNCDGDSLRNNPEKKIKKTLSSQRKQMKDIENEMKSKDKNSWSTSLENICEKVYNNMVLEGKNSSDCFNRFKYSDNESNCSVNVFYTDNRQQWLDRGDNLKTLAMSDLEVSEVEVPQSANDLSFNWKDRQFNSIREKKDRNKNVVNKLYHRLKSLRSDKDISDSEITSTSVEWDSKTKQSNNDNFCYDDATLSSMDSVRVSVDTVQSVTQTVIKRLAKSYPKEKTT